MNDITIVTAFFDIGRGDWTPDRFTTLSTSNKSNIPTTIWSHG